MVVPHQLTYSQSLHLPQHNMGLGPDQAFYGMQQIPEMDVQQVMVP